MFLPLLEKGAEGLSCVSHPPYECPGVLATTQPSATSVPTSLVTLRPATWSFVPTQGVACGTDSQQGRLQTCPFSPGRQGAQKSLWLHPWDLGLQGGPSLCQPGLPAAPSLPLGPGAHSLLHLDLSLIVLC